MADVTPAALRAFVEQAREEHPCSEHDTNRLCGLWRDALSLLTEAAEQLDKLQLVIRDIGNAHAIALVAAEAQREKLETDVERIEGEAQEQAALCEAMHAKLIAAQQMCVRAVEAGEALKNERDQAQAALVAAEAQTRLLREALLDVWCRHCEWTPRERLEEPVVTISCDACSGRVTLLGAGAAPLKETPCNAELFSEGRIVRCTLHAGHGGVVHRYTAPLKE